MGPFPEACQLAPHCTAGTCGSENTKATHARRVVQFSSQCPPLPPPPHAPPQPVRASFRKYQWAFVLLPVLLWADALKYVCFWMFCGQWKGLKVWCVGLQWLVDSNLAAQYRNEQKPQTRKAGSQYYMKAGIYLKCCLSHLYPWVCLMS